MTIEEAEEIIDLRIELEDWSCSCHLFPPCSKCVDMPSDEEYEEALKVIENNE